MFSFGYMWITDRYMWITLDISDLPSSNSKLGGALLKAAVARLLDQLRKFRVDLTPLSLVIFSGSL